MIDGCRVGLCEVYSTGSQPLALIIGGTIGAILIALLIRRRRQRRRRDSEQGRDREQ